MQKDECLDYLLIQSIIDGEEKDQEAIRHLQGCPACQEMEIEIGDLIVTAKKLACDESLPAGFYASLSNKIDNKPFPVSLMAAVIFILAIASAFFLEPGYLNWWLSVGITRQLGVFFDTFFELFYLGSSLDPGWLIMFLAVFVLVEILILTRINRVEEAMK